MLGLGFHVRVPGEPMSVPKPHIKPKADPCQRQMPPPDRDAPPYTEWDPPVFSERDGDVEQGAQGAQGAAERVLFHEDDCLR